MGPPPSVPAATRTSAARCWATSQTSTGVIDGASAASRTESSATRAARKSFWRQNRTTPTLNRSPRSTLGTTRRMRYVKGLAAGSGTLGLLHEPPVAQPPPQVLEVYLGRIGAGQPLGRHEIHRGLDRSLFQSRAHPLVGFRDRAGARQQHVVGD